MKTCTALVAALILFGLLLPEANAAHPTQMCLDIEPENHTAYQNDGVVDRVTAHVEATDAGHPPEEEGCVSGESSGAGSQVDFEITGSDDPDEAYSPETPDGSCDIPEGDSSCTFEPPSGYWSGQTITAWVDFDRDDSTTELDRAEGPNETSEPGDMGEPDATDVVQWQWVHDDYFLWISIGYQRDRERFVGTVNTQPGCAMHRKVTVKKKVEDRRVRVGSDVTDQRGKWSVPLKDANGRYFAVAGSRFADADAYRCRRLRSATIRVR